MRIVLHFQVLNSVLKHLLILLDVDVVIAIALTTAVTTTVEYVIEYMNQCNVDCFRIKRDYFVRILC